MPISHFSFPFSQLQNFVGSNKFASLPDDDDVGSGDSEQIKEERNTESADKQSEIFRQREKIVPQKNQYCPIICATGRANSNDVVTKEQDDKNDDPSTTSTTSELQ